MTNQITMNFWVKSVVWVALGCDQHLDSVLDLHKSLDPWGNSYGGFMRSWGKCLRKNEDLSWGILKKHGEKWGFGFLLWENPTFFSMETGGSPKSETFGMKPGDSQKKTVRFRPWKMGVEPLMEWDLTTRNGDEPPNIGINPWKNDAAVCTQFAY